MITGTAPYNENQRPAVCYGLTNDEQIRIAALNAVATNPGPHDMFWKSVQAYEHYIRTGEI